MSNMILAYGNLADQAELSGGGWLPDLPITNIQDRRLEVVARSISPAPVHTQFDGAFLTPRLIKVVALVNHTFGSLAKRRIRLSSTPDFSDVVADSGWGDVWPTVYPFGTLPWGSPSWWTGKYSPDQIASYNGTLVWILPNSVNARFIRVEVDDQNNPAGYVQFGRLFLADGWQPVRNMTYGASLAWEDRSEVQEALSGAEYFDERGARRVVKFQLPGMSEAEAMAQAFDIQQGVGITKEVLFVWDPDDTVHAIRRQFLGRLRTLSPIENPGPDRWRSPFEVQELL